ncbi:MAG: hypothetical protein ACK4IT_09600 [Thioalkalivibrionaceae bacterium]
MSVVFEWRLLWPVAVSPHASPPARPRWWRDWPDDLPLDWRREWLAGQRLGLWFLPAEPVSADSSSPAPMESSMAQESGESGDKSIDARAAWERGVIAGLGVPASAVPTPAAPMHGEYEESAFWRVDPANQASGAWSPGEPFLVESLQQDAKKPRCVIRLTGPGLAWSLAPSGGLRVADDHRNNEDTDRCLRKIGKGPDDRVDRGELVAQMSEALANDGGSGASSGLLWWIDERTDSWGLWNRSGVDAASLILIVRFINRPQNLMAWREWFAAIIDLCGSAQCVDHDDLPSSLDPPRIRCVVGVDASLAQIEQWSTLIDLLGYARA